MRGRPLCISCAVFVMALFLLLTIKPPPMYNNETLEGRTVMAAGTVSALRYRNEKLHIYLKNVQVSLQVTSDEKSNTESLDSEGDDKKSFDKESLEGVVCYLSPGQTRPKMGSSVLIRGTFYNFSPATNPGQFDMASYYRARDLEGSMANSEILRYGKAHSFVSEGLYLLRERFETALDESLPQSESGIMKAMLLGDKDCLDKDIRSLFEKAGCSHLLVVSALHLSVIALAVFECIKRTTGNDRAAAVAGMVFILLYAEMTGMGISALRAVIMYVICALGRLIGRTYDIVTSMGIAWMMVLAGNIFLIFDSAFLLSFSAVMGIALVTPVFGEYTRSFGRVFETVSAGLSVSIFTLPVTLLFFCRFCIYSVFLNLLLVPSAAVLLVAGLLLILTGSVHIPLIPDLISYICRGIIWVYMKLCGFTLSLPGSLRITGKPGTWRIALYYLLLAFLLWLYYRSALPGREKTKKYALVRYAVPLILILQALVFVLWPARTDGMTFMMLDVGQGDGLLAYTKNGCVIMDCGSTDEDKVGEYRLIPALKALGIDRIDLAVISHTDADHINGIAQLLTMAKDEGIDIGGLAMSYNSALSDAGAALKKSAAGKGIGVFLIGAGDAFEVDKMRFECLYPGKEDSGEPNELSVVLSLKYGDFLALLTGDMEGEGEKQVIDKLDDRRYALYKCAHHGSRGTNSRALLEKIRPRVTLISCGRDNSYGHPHREALERIKDAGSLIYTTPRCGAIALHTDGKKMKIEGYLKISPVD